MGPNTVTADARASAERLAPRSGQDGVALGDCLSRCPAAVFAADHGEEALDGIHSGVHSHRREDVERVLRARHLGEHDWLFGGLAELVDEGASLLDRHERVVRSMDDEEGRRVLADVTDRGGLLPTGAVGRRVRLEHLLREEVLHVRTTGAVSIEEVVDAVERHRGGDRRVDLFEARLERLDMRRERGQGREMAARRSSRDHEEIGIAAVLGDARLRPRQRPLHIDDVIRPCRFW